MADFGVPEQVLQLIQERPHGGKVRPRNPPLQPSGWSIVDTSRIAFLMAPAPDLSGQSAPSDRTQASEQKPSEEKCEWSRAAARRKPVSGGLGNGAVSGRQLKQHREDSVRQQKLKIAILEARMLGSSTVTVKPLQEPASRRRYTAPPPASSSHFDLERVSGPGISPKGTCSIGFRASESYGAFEDGGSESTTSSDVTVPVGTGRTERKGNEGNTGDRTDSYHRIRLPSEVVLVPWSTAAHHGRIERMVRDKGQKTWI